MMGAHVDRKRRFTVATCGSRRRAGISLIELMVVISILTALMSFATVLMALLFRSDHAGHDAMAEQLAIAHLSRQLRADVHAATDVVVPQDNSGVLELTLEDGRRVAWAAAGTTVARTASRDDAVVARDSYELSEGVTTFSVVETEGIVRLRHSGVLPEVLEKAAETAAAPSNVLTIDAAVGIAIPVVSASGTTANSETP